MLCNDYAHLSQIQRAATLIHEGFHIVHRDSSKETRIKEYYFAYGVYEAEAEWVAIIALAINGFVARPAYGYTGFGDEIRNVLMQTRPELYTAAVEPGDQLSIPSTWKTVSNSKGDQSVPVWNYRNAKGDYEQEDMWRDADFASSRCWVATPLKLQVPSKRDKNWSQRSEVNIVRVSTDSEGFLNLFTDDPVVKEIDCAIYPFLNPSLTLIRALFEPARVSL